LAKIHSSIWPKIIPQTVDYPVVFCYLSLVMDVYTEEIVGWSVGETLDAIYLSQCL
jgi:transposase InsO family protein